MVGQILKHQESNIVQFPSEQRALDCHPKPTSKKHDFILKKYESEVSKYHCKTWLTGENEMKRLAGQIVFILLMALIALIIHNK